MGMYGSRMVAVEWVVLVGASVSTRPLKFEQQLSAARRERSALESSGTADAILAHAGLTTEHRITIDHERYALGGALKSALGLDEKQPELNRLHTLIPNFSPSAAHHA